MNNLEKEKTMTTTTRFVTPSGDDRYRSFNRRLLVSLVLTLCVTATGGAAQGGDRLLKASTPCVARAFSWRSDSWPASK